MASTTPIGQPRRARASLGRASFSPPADIAKVLVTSGDPSDFESRLDRARSSWTFMDAKAACLHKQFDLQDVKDFQTLDVAPAARLRW